MVSGRVKYRAAYTANNSNIQGGKKHYTRFPVIKEPSVAKKWYDEEGEGEGGQGSQYCSKNDDVIYQQPLILLMYNITTTTKTFAYKLDIILFVVQFTSSETKR